MPRLLRFIVSRLLWMALVVFGVSILTFLLIHSIPGNPWTASPQLRGMFNVTLDPVSMKALDRQFGLDRPLLEQYTRYMFGSQDEEGRFVCGAVCGNLGPSFRRGGDVTVMLFGVPEGRTIWQSRFGYTIRLAMYGFLFTALIGIPLGIALAVRAGSVFESAVSAFLNILVGIPNFVLGILLIILLSSWLHLIRVLPNWDDPSGWIVPVFVLGAVPTVSMARLTQAATREAMSGEYVRTAQAKGLRRERVVFRHVLPNALAPVITALLPVLIELVAGSFIVEALFGFPGIGREFWTSILEKDFPVIMGLTLLYSLGIVLMNGLVELAYGLIDSRLRDEGTAHG
jgi:ABC-type dipeptide/oligopeptide/nickel transport system permease component